MKTLESTPLSTLLPLLFLLPSFTLSQSLTDDSKCGCYLSKSSNDTLFFSQHRFFDFRSLSQYAGVPPAIQDSATSSSAEVTSPYFKSSPFTDFWMLGSWNNSNGVREDATVTMINSPNNVYIEADSSSSSDDKNKPTFLTLRTQRMQTFQTSAEIESTSSKFQYLSMRMLARTLGSPGAITAMFTYRDSAQLSKVQESDLEIRTSDPQNVIHYTNQPSYTDEGGVLPQATKNATMPGGLKWTDWAVHRLDWTPKYTAWFVNDVPVAQTEFQVPRDVSNIILNAWSDGGKWTGNMSLWDAAYLQVQWFEIVYNSTEEIKGAKAKAKSSTDGQGGCQSVCSVDGTSQVGKPVMLWDNGVGRTNGGVSRWLVMSVAAGLGLFMLV